jgi:hypothetical protein
MKEPEWHNVLEPREAVIAGVLGLAAMWALGALGYFDAGYIFWDLTPFQRKEWGTLLMVLGFAVPYCLVKWLVKR